MILRSVRAITLFLFILTFGFLLVGHRLSKRQLTENTIQPTYAPETATLGEQNEQAMVYLTINDGVSDETYYDVPFTEGDTPYSLLRAAAAENKLELTADESDSQVAVIALDGQVNSSDASWVYSVNGERVSQSPDQYELAPGDLVEWRYLAFPATQPATSPES